MFKYLLVFTAFIFGHNFSFSQCTETNEEKVLLVGDSWGFLMNLDGTINKVLSDWGHSSYKYYSNLSLVVVGAETVDFLVQAKLDEITNQLINKPSIEYVHLSIGGNDVLGSWKSQSFSQFQTDSLRLEVKNNVIQLIEFIKSIRSDIKIVWSGYAYPNFEEVITGSLIPSAHPFHGKWIGMESPTSFELNGLLNLFSSDIENHYANDSRVAFINATGITQHTYGQVTPLAVPPYGSYAPFSAALPIGNVSYPSPKTSMRTYGVFKDCFHLSIQGYKDLLGYTTQKFYHKAFMDDKYFVAENNVTTGSVSSDGNVSTKLMVGEDNGVVHQTILTFETLYNLDFIVEKASIFFHIKESTGGNPIDEDIFVEVNDGAIGVSAAIEVQDFSAPSKAEGNPCVFGSNTDGKWVRLDLPSELLEFITVNDITQFKITAPFVFGQTAELSGTENTDFAPVLNVSYGTEAVVALPKEKIKQNVLIYPNPTVDFISIEVNSADIINIKLYSIDGREMLSTKNTQINLSSYPAGSYFIHVSTDKGISRQKLIKR
ncbi:MAG TPA: SGNH/GDSL hydrolase family protein [Brumimicrobium sp.]|nr:SGNH/GDSL hydrolase family protein [Brumimicrobium sp.]